MKQGSAIKHSPVSVSDFSQMGDSIFLFFNFPQNLFKPDGKQDRSKRYCQRVRNRLCPCF